MDSLIFLPSVRDFYCEAEILITGGTGFIGKVLLERLLLTCPEIKRVYLIVRQRKSESVQSRIKEFSECDV